MKRSLTLWLGGAALLSTLLVPGRSAEARRKVVAAPKSTVVRATPAAEVIQPIKPEKGPIPDNGGRRVRAQTQGLVPIKQVVGRLDLAQAVNIALRQNPEILRSLQEIQRTRGLIIEVRAAALPQLTVNGTYNQQDRRLLRSGAGGQGGQGGNNSGLSGLNLDQNAFSANSEGAGRDVSGTGNVDQGGAGNTAGNGSADFSQIFQQISNSLNQAQQGSSQYIQNKSWNITFQVTQALYTGGQITSAIKIAKFSQDTAYYQLHDVVDRIVTVVRQQFYQVLLNRELIVVSEEAVRLARQQLQDQRNRFEAGTVPRFNVLRAEVEVSNEEPNLIRARNNYLISQIQLAKTLGLDPGPTGRPTFQAVGLLTVPPRKLTLPDALALARARRPYLKVQRLSILIDTEQIQLEMAGYKPRLSANAGYLFRNRNASQELSDVVNGWFFGVSGSWNIFDGFETYGRVKQARARLEQSRVTYDDSVLQVELEVQLAFAELEQARQTIESQQKNVEQAAEALRLAEERFTAGAGTQLEVLDARVALTRTRTTELQSRADYLRALAEFDRATATDTIYEQGFRDPLDKVEKGILAKLAETGLPKSREAAANR